MKEFRTMTTLSRRWPAMAVSVALLLAMATAQPAHAASAANPTKSGTAPAAGGPTGEDDKTLYALGVLVSRNLETFNLTPAEFKLVQQGLADGFNHHPSLDADSYNTKLQAMQRTRLGVIDEHQKTAGQAYLDKAAALPGAQKTATGMVFISVSEGKGATPDKSDRVSVIYEGKLIDGTVFDSSAKHNGGQPVSMTLSGIIPCWTEALQLMKVGGKSRIICPAALAYGDRGAPPKIKPGSTLEFDIELISIEPPAPAPALPPLPGASGGAAPGAPGSNRP
jgi:FKBP-type peptidyl-prolyl cis-trans isomerase FkpA